VNELTARGHIVSIKLSTVEVCEPAIIVTRLQAGVVENGDPISNSNKNLCLCHYVWTRSDAYPACCMGIWELKELRCEPNSSYSSCLKVKKHESCPYVRISRLVACPT
jgi:hypothetical protein